MKNQVLSIEQMQKLKELGVDTSKASMAVYNIYAGEQKEYDILAANGAFAEKQEHDRFGYGIHNVVSFDKKPVFTLQDIIESLQGTKSFYFRKECENFYLKIEKFSDTNYSISYENSDHFIVGFSGSCLLTCAYNMLIWVAENGYLTSK